MAVMPPNRRWLEDVSDHGGVILTTGHTRYKITVQDLGQPDEATDEQVRDAIEEIEDNEGSEGTGDV